MINKRFSESLPVFSRVPQGGVKNIKNTSTTLIKKAIMCHCLIGLLCKYHLNGITSLGYH